MGHRLFIGITMVALSCIALTLCRCSKPSSPSSTATITGTVTLENQTSYEGVTVKLYSPAEINQDLANIQSLHPQVGPPIDQRVVFDYRLADLIFSTETASDGSYSFENISSGTYVVVAEKAGFGYQERFDVTAKSGGKTVVPQIDLLEEKELVGNLTANTVLEARRHYIVSGDVTVPAGITLTIEPGVHLKFDGYYTLLVNGRLVAAGTEEEMIVFTSGQEVPAKDDWKRLEFTSSGTGSEIEWCKVEYATTGIYGKGVTLTLSHNVIRSNAADGILIFSTFDLPVEVKNHLILDNNQGIWLEDVDNAIIEGNIVFENQELGIGCQESSPVLKNNLCKANKYGMYVVYNSDPLCRNNSLLNNEWGIMCGGYSKPMVRLCDFANNLLGAIFVFIPPRGCRAQPTIRFNNFDEQTGLVRIEGFRTAPNDLDIDATNNYWGGLSIEEIDRLIWDKNDVTPEMAPYVATVNYLPMEAAPVDSAGLQ